MALFRRKRDPIREREERVRAQLAEIQARLNKLSAEAAQAPTEPRWRSTAQPNPTPAASAPATSAPAFEQVNHQRVQNPFDPRARPAHLNERGIARYDLFGSWRRWWQRRRGQPPRNPQLVAYLAAGGIQGLPALRHEKRVARNRFLLLCGITILLFWGAFYYWLREHP